MITRMAITLLVVASSVRAANLPMDSARGEMLFATLSCIRCHSINGVGGKIGPDLGNRLDRGFTPATLASTMWNHAPAMWAAVRVQDVRPGDLDEQAAADLFAYFYAARFFEKPGDAGRGKRFFSALHCAECHGLKQAILPAAKPVAEWQSMNHPVEMVTLMWDHATAMRAEFAQHKIAWPTLTPQDLTDILVYIRGVPGTVRQPDLMLLTSGENGQALFDSKGCSSCHNGKLALGPRLRGRTLTDIAVDMWNHEPLMAKTPPSLDLQEMRDLLSYLWAQQFFEGNGNPAAGKRVFTKKHCATCHEDASSGAPKLTGGQRSFNGAVMVSVLWRHGPQMMERMRTKGIAWPRFNGAGMANLIAYLNAGNRGQNQEK